jgi:hypothetical protein
MEAACTSKMLAALPKPTQCKDSRGNVVNALKELGKIKLRFSQNIPICPTPS